jgi:hypothetical protein
MAVREVTVVAGVRVVRASEEVEDEGEVPKDDIDDRFVP